MTASNNPYYCPALRMKGGELSGIRDLAVDVADRVRPRLIVPPPAERDNALQAQLFASEAFPDISTALVTHWGRRPALVEATYLIDEFGRDRLGLWLPKMFENARSAGGQPIPLVALRDLLESPADMYRSTIDTTQALKFSLAISSGDLTDDEFVRRGLGVLEQLGLAPEDCVVVADFHDADFSDADMVAPIIGGVLETLQEAAPWQQIVFQGTNYPEKNPADPNGNCIIPRNEWAAWRRAISFDLNTADRMIFGDYAADCAKINFGSKGGAAAIRHHRYTTPDAWLVQRGSTEGRHFETMRDVCKAIVESGKFAGRDFSTADEHIYMLSKGRERPGGAREWRSINTTHHITRVVTDIGALLGLTFTRAKSSTPSDQLELDIGIGKRELMHIGRGTS